MKICYTFLSLIIAIATPVIHAVELENISITSSRTPVSLSATGSAITVISEQDLQDSQKIYIADVLRTVPGVAISQAGGSGQFTQVRMRGSEGNHVLVIIDGIEYNPGNGNSVNIAHLLTSNVEQIEILRGTQSTLWGSDAIGGVIAITTHRGRTGKTKVLVTQQEGSFNSSNQALSISGGSERTTYAVHLNRINRDGFSAADDDSFTYTLPDGSGVTQGGSGIENDGYENRTLGTTINHQFSAAWSVNATVREINYELESDSFEGGTGAIDDPVSVSASEGIYAQNTIRYSQLDDRLQHRLKVADTDLDDKFFSSRGQSSTRAKKRQTSYQLDYYFPQSSNNDNSHAVTMALEREKVSNDSSFSGLHENLSKSTIIEYRYDFAENFSTAIAYRHDTNEIFKNTESGHASLSYNINSILRLHSSVGSGIKNPTLRELFGSSTEFPGNAGLKAEKSDSKDLGIAWQINNDRAVDFTLFDLAIRNQITGSGKSSINVDGDARATGVELYYRDVIGNFILTSSMTNQKSEDASGNDLVRRADTIMSVRGTHRFFSNKLNITLGIDYNGSQFDYYFDPSFNRFRVKIDSYTVVNWATHYQVNKTITLTGRIDNLFDERYQEVIGYGTEQRAYYLGLRLELWQ